MIDYKRKLEEYLPLAAEGIILFHSDDELDPEDFLTRFDAFLLFGRQDWPEDLNASNTFLR